MTLVPSLAVLFLFLGPVSATVSHPLARSRLSLRPLRSHEFHLLPASIRRHSQASSSLTNRVPLPAPFHGNTIGRRENDGGERRCSTEPAVATLAVQR